jgi:hypothetical protein
MQTYKEIKFPQLCALVRSIIQKDPKIPDSEWKARTLDTLAKWGFAEPADPEMVGRAMSQVEFAVRKTLGPRPLQPLVATPEPLRPKPPDFKEARTNRPAGWDLVQRLMTKLQASASSAPLSPAPTEPREVLALTEEAVLAEFWRGAADVGKRLSLLQTFAELAILRPAEWDVAAIRAQASHHALTAPDGCFVCFDRVRSFQWHHVIQIQFGGSNYLRNRVPLCDVCHGRVHPWLPALERTAGFYRVGILIPDLIDRLSRKRA